MVVVQAAATPAHGNRVSGIQVPFQESLWEIFANVKGVTGSNYVQT